MKTALKYISSFFTFFLLVAFVITCCTMLFVSTLQSSMELTLTEADISAAARLTFWNTALLSLIFTVIDGIRRKFTVERPAKRITDAAQRIMQGDFSVRIAPTGRLGAEDVFGDISQCIDQMARELGGVETLRTDFIANVSHEMKTPLAVMQNYGTLLQEPGLSEEARLAYARGITEASRRLADMMTNILKLNKLENQQVYPRTAEFDLGEQICESLLQYESVWEKAGIGLEAHIAEGVTVKADSELLGLVWNNLFSNAFKFTPSGGTVTVTLTADEKFATVQVRDTGCGMTAEVGAHIFEKFYQGDASRATQGNGLGLALVKRVMDILHGEITVESGVGKGSAFTVKLRRA